MVIDSAHAAEDMRDTFDVLEYAQKVCDKILVVVV